MELKDFHKVSAKALAHIDEVLGGLELDELDVQLAGDVLTLAFADGTRYVINAHSAALRPRGRRPVGRAQERRRADDDGRARRRPQARHVPVLVNR